MNNPWTDPPAQPTRPAWLTEGLATELTNNLLPVDQDGMLLLHKRAKENLDHWKEKEMELRKVCASFLVPEKTEGTNTVELGNGFQAKVVIKYNYKLDSDNDKVWAGLEKIEKLGNEGKFIAERLVSWSPNFLLTEYRQLQEDADKGSLFAKSCLEVISEFMTVVEAAPTLEIKAPKEKKKMTNWKVSGIYKIINLKNGKFYVGSAVNLSLRWSQHNYDLNLKNNANTYLQRAYNKYGKESFKFEVLEYCDLEILLEREQYWIDKLNACDRNIGYIR